MPTDTNSTVQNDGQFIAHPRDILDLAKILLGDLKILEEKTKELGTNYKALGQTYKDDGYQELGKEINAIGSQLVSKEKHMELVILQLNKYAEDLIELLAKKGE